MYLNLKSNSKAWITKIAHYNVSLRSGKDLSLDTKKLLMSHCFADIDVKCATPILMSLSWIFSSPNNSIVLKFWELWLAINFKSSIEFVVHLAFFHPYYLLLLHYRFWKKIVTLSRLIGIITREFYSIKFVSKIEVIISRCSINKGDIIEVRVYVNISCGPLNK